ncbi:uncharacterized protein [Henckelia pumila]|uniref:uncharacterized protein n=1 Tax=Henckelia pumila TaxID=405737 RepID=UPI003C6E9E0F
MKFLLEFFSCCLQPGRSSRSAEDKGLLSVPEHSVKLDGAASPQHEYWKPSLVSISEDDIFAELQVTSHNIEQERGRRQISSSSSRRASPSSSNAGRAPVSTVFRPTLVSSSRRIRSWTESSWLAWGEIDRSETPCRRVESI